MGGLFDGDVVVFEFFVEGGDEDFEHYCRCDGAAEDEDGGDL